MFDFIFLWRILMCENEKSLSKIENNITLGWLKLFIIGKNNTPSSRTVYICKDKKIYAVLHTDTTGATKSISLPAKKVCGTEYVCLLDNGEKRQVNVYPYVVNIHYIDKNTEDV